ncbi:hypothetical protein EL22_28235 [Halostagnicola sp. A56]|nr:hypothetical protein EL22_28235 [Halostagnicola sp. A56]
MSGPTTVVRVGYFVVSNDAESIHDLILNRPPSLELLFESPFVDVFETAGIERCLEILKGESVVEDINIAPEIIGNCFGWLLFLSVS